MNLAAHNLHRGMRGAGVIWLEHAARKELAVELAGCAEQLLVHRRAASQA